MPNISASVPQLKAAIDELQGQGFDIPDYPEDPSDDDQRDVRARYDKVKGSAVNPVLRQGNSDRRAPASVKQYARQHPHSMGAWSSDSPSHVSTMSDGDFRCTEQSVTVDRPGAVRVKGSSVPTVDVTLLKENIKVQAGEVLDASVMRRAALREFLAGQLEDAKERDVLFSVHLKATMMRVSDPIIFGHAVRVYFSRVFEEHGEALKAAGVDPNDGLGALLKSIQSLLTISAPRSKPRSRRRTLRGRGWRWSTPTVGSPTSTFPVTCGSSTPRCRPRSARRGRCGMRTASSRTQSS